MNPIDFLSSVIRAKAEAQDRNLLIVNDPPELAHYQMRSSSMQGIDAEFEELPSFDDEPLPVSGLFVGHKTILIGSLAVRGITTLSNASEREPILSRWGKYQRRCAIARSWLPIERSDDLILFLTGPAGSYSDPEWIALAAQIERNDLVCRKLVWLPPTSEDEWENSIILFLRRTFLARPWTTGAMIVQQPLDALADVSNSLMNWQSILDAQPAQRSDVDYDELIATLIQEYKP